MKNILLFIVLIWIASSISAQTDTLLLETIMVKGKRGGRGTKQCVTSSHFTLDAPHDVGAIFKKEAGFAMVKRGNFAVEPVLRGFKYDQLNVQVDGGTHIDNACPNRMDPITAHIMPEEVEKVEVIKGPYSVRYGQNDGGVINLVTKHPAPSKGWKVKGSLHANYQSNGGNKATSTDIRLSSAKWDMSLYAGWKDFGNYKSGDGTQISSSFRNKDYAVKAAYNPNTNNRIQLTWRQGFARDIMHAGLPMDAEKDDGSILSLDYGGHNLTQNLFSLKAKIYLSMVDHLMSNALRPNAMMMLGVTPVTSMTTGGRVEAGWTTSSRNTLFAGADLKRVAKDGTKHLTMYKKKVGDSIITINPPVEKDIKVWQNSYINDVGFFAENHHSFSSDLGWKTGIRLDVVSSGILDADPLFAALYEENIQPQAEYNFAFNTTFNYRLNEQTHLQWAAGRGMRSANQQERYINHFSVGSDAFQYVGNPYLKPETNYQTDIVLRRNGKNYEMYIDVFYSYLRDYISAAIDSTLTSTGSMTSLPFAKRFINIDRAIKYGFEAGANIQLFAKLFWNTNISYVYAQDLVHEEPLPEIPPLTVNSSVDYRYRKFRTKFVARFAAKQNRIAKSFMESETPGFKVFDVHFMYDVKKFLQLHFYVSNMLNENYYEHLSRAYQNWGVNSGMNYYEPGRSFNMSISLKF